MCVIFNDIQAMKIKVILKLSIYLPKGCFALHTSYLIDCLPPKYNKIKMTLIIIRDSKHSDTEWLQNRTIISKL